MTDLHSSFNRTGTNSSLTGTAAAAAAAAAVPDLDPAEEEDIRFTGESVLLVVEEDITLVDDRFDERFGLSPLSLAAAAAIDAMLDVRLERLVS